MLRLGATYLRGHAEERDRAILARHLVGEGAEPIELKLIEAISRDWQAHDVVQAEGWILARTEARLCAFLRLSTIPA